jgi:hypothetical protein
LKGSTAPARNCTEHCRASSVAGVGSNTGSRARPHPRGRPGVRRWARAAGPARSGTRPLPPCCARNTR